jgi:hypothetical protein
MILSILTTSAAVHCRKSFLIGRRIMVKSFSKVLGVAMVVLWLIAGAGLYAQNKEKGQKDLVGVISNTHCGLKHSTPNADDAGCVNSCVLNFNASYALVAFGRIYKLDGMPDEFAKFAGQRVKVTGKMERDTMHVAAVEPSK